MISLRLKKLVKLSIFLFIIHAFEEYYTGLLTIDPMFSRVSGLIKISSVTFYIAEQILLVAFLLWGVYRPKRWVHIGIGILFIYEISHVISAIENLSYYPGLVTAVLLLIVGFVYWKELLKVNK